MDLARLESGRGVARFQDADAADLVRAAGERLGEQVARAGLELTYEVPEALPEVLVDRRRVEQVVINLVHNAIKFTPPGGTVTIAARQRGDWIAVDVRDTGAGIAAGEVDRLFERFSKSDTARRSDGAGLGLAIARQIVQVHRGALSVRSEQGRGSAFTFTLPVATSPAASALRDPAALAAHA